MAAMRYTTVELVTENLREATGLWNGHAHLFSNPLTNLQATILYNTVVDRERADRIFEIVTFYLQLDQDNQVQGVALLKDLVKCGTYACQDIYNSNSRSASEDKDNLFGRMHLFLRRELGVEPIPTLSQREATKEAATRKEAHIRDSGKNGDLWSGSLCPLTGLPHAEMAHILPVKAAGATAGHRWFWLWAAIILPKPTFDAAWAAGGGHQQHAISNVLMLCHPLHQYYDALDICFKPLIEDPTAVAFRVVLQTCPDTDLQLFNLRSKDGHEFLRRGLEIWWRPSTSATQETAPSPLLLSLHRYAVFTRRFFRSGRMPEPPPAPPQPSASADPENIAWDAVAGTPRSMSGTPRSGFPSRPATPRRPLSEDYGVSSRSPAGRRSLSGDRGTSSRSPGGRGRGMAQRGFGGDAQLDSDGEETRGRYPDDVDNDELDDEHREPKLDRAAALQEFRRVFLADLVPEADSQ